MSSGRATQTQTIEHASGPIHILVIDCGASRLAAAPLRSMLESANGSHYEITELDLSCPAAPGQVDRLSACISRRNPHILVTCFSAARWLSEAEAFFELAQDCRWGVPVVALAPVARPEDLIRLLALGGSDYLTLPLRPEEVLPRLWACHRQGPLHSAGSNRWRTRPDLAHILGESPAMLALLEEIPVMARCDACVLLVGETGTGKEVFARAIHALSARRGKPFVPVNCGAIPPELLENELFGHEPGAFTSANASRRGILAEADGGTLFLDEVACLAPMAQVKLLRFLQDGTFRPLGAERSRHADLRIIAASNVDFDEAMETGRFRRDLYYRLNVLNLSLPPLRKRVDDIPILARSFVEAYARKFGTPARALSQAALTKLLCHDWPGNVRELENVVERAVILCRGTLIQPADLRIQPASGASADAGFQQLKTRTIHEFERRYIQQLLRAHDGNITHAARSAKKDRRAFWELMRKHRLNARPLSDSTPRPRPPREPDSDRTKDGLDRTSLS